MPAESPRTGQALQRLKHRYLLVDGVVGIRTAPFQVAESQLLFYLGIENIVGSVRDLGGSGAAEDVALGVDSDGHHCVRVGLDIPCPCIGMHLAARQRLYALDVGNFLSRVAIPYGSFQGDPLSLQCLGGGALVAKLLQRTLYGGLCLPPALIVVTIGSGRNIDGGWHALADGGQRDLCFAFVQRPDAPIVVHLRHRHSFGVGHRFAGLPVEWDPGPPDHRGTTAATTAAAALAFILIAAVVFVVGGFPNPSAVCRLPILGDRVMSGVAFGDRHGAVGVHRDVTQTPSFAPSRRLLDAVHGFEVHWPPAFVALVQGPRLQSVSLAFERVGQGFAVPCLQSQ